ncbi:BON domain-containing protein [Oxalobacteraceae bacterium CAVE-383]|nr:BON domain-containing protein [Oxalobacteraceae bacterium CAVE-383]
MSSKLRTAAFVIGTLMVPFAAHAADSTTSTGESKPVRAIKDSAITTKVKAKLAEERAGYTKSVHVKTTPDGVVTLTGTALTKDEADKAAAIAKSTDGVTSVVNNIKVTK